jgi:hypothetical protein
MTTNTNRKTSTKSSTKTRATTTTGATMTTELPRPRTARKRSHAAAGSRVLLAGVSASATIGLAGMLAANAAQVAPVPVGTVPAVKSASGKPVRAQAKRSATTLPRVPALVALPSTPAQVPQASPLPAPVPPPSQIVPGTAAPIAPAPVAPAPVAAPAPAPVPAPVAPAPAPVTAPPVTAAPKPPPTVAPPVTVSQPS